MRKNGQAAPSFARIEMRGPAVANGPAAELRQQNYFAICFSDGDDGNRFGGTRFTEEVRGYLDSRTLKYRVSKIRGSNKPRTYGTRTVKLRNYNIRLR